MYVRQGGDGIGIVGRIKSIIGKSMVESNAQKEMNAQKSMNIRNAGDTREVTDRKAYTADRDSGFEKKHDIVGNRAKMVKNLTPREREAFLLLIEGHTLKETAKGLNISYSTANTYQTAIYRKLQVNSRAELIINYMEIATAERAAY